MCELNCFFFFYKVLMNNFQGFSTNISPCCLSLSFASTNQRAVAIRDGASHCVAKQLVNNFYNRLMTEGDTHSTEGFIQTSHTHTHTPRVLCSSSMFCFYLHVVHDGQKEPSQSAALLLHYRIHFPPTKEKKNPSQKRVPSCEERVVVVCLFFLNQKLFSNTI